MDYKNLALQYFDLFSQKDIKNLKLLFSHNIIDHVTLRDWEISADGLDEVIAANEQIFNGVDTIKVTPLALYQQGNTVVAEIRILVNGTETLLVTDIIDFNDDGKIVNIRAFKG